MADVALARTRAAAPLREVRAAVAFLTRVPVTDAVSPPGTTGAAAFPLVGAAIGAGASVPLVLVGPGHAFIGAIVAVAIGAMVSGGLHLDGLGDTVDALAAPPDAAERARTDPRAGSAAVAAIALTLALEVAALAELAGRDAGRAIVAIVVAGAVSRAMAPILAVTLGRARRPAAGLGGWFADRVTTVGAVAAAAGALIAVLASALVAPELALSALAGTTAAAAVALGVVGARRQLDGDGYGFAIEATFAFILVAAALVA